ncbi:MAG: HAMP domain-containing protein, partial [Actinomycetia bacterium]|nr:HAMP domain-containing protein [Actinomycetes bacterium]
MTTARSKKYSRIILTNQSGAAVSATPSKKDHEQYAKKSWWQETINQKNSDVFIGNLHFHSDIDKYLINVAIPIRDADPPAGQKSKNAPANGLLIMELTLDRLFEDIVKKKVADDIHLNIVDSNRNLVLSEGNFMKSKVTKPLYREIAQPEPTWKVTNNEEKTISLIGTAPIILKRKFKSDIFSKDKHWYVMAQQPLFDAYAPIIDLMKKIFVLGWGAVLVIFLLGYFGAGQIIKPLKKLKAGAHQIGEGNLNVRLDLESGDEIQDLAEEFNHMAIALKSSQQRLRAVNEQLRDASKLKSEFLASMSHELRTPLNSIIGFAEVMVDQLFGPLNPKQQKHMNNIHTSGHHLLQLINDILDLSKIEAGKL